MIININGRFYKDEDAKVSVLDRGFLYGDGIFETMRAYNGRIFALDEHIKRLRNSAKAVLLAVPWTDEEIKNELVNTLRKNRLENAVLRISFSRGNGWGLGLPARPEPVMAVLCREFRPCEQKFYKNGVDVIISKKIVSYSGSVLGRVKSTNYIPNILAKNEADNAGAFDALTVNENGYILEGSAGNFFIVSNNILITAPLEAGILPGITRGIVLKLAERSGVRFKEKMFKPDLIYKADEAFLTNTSIEILPVRKVDDKIIPSCGPGSITLKLAGKFSEMVRRAVS